MPPTNRSVGADPPCTANDKPPGVEGGDFASEEGCSGTTVLCFAKGSSLESIVVTFRSSADGEEAVADA
eukprot:1712129-Pyramimonas_sp.AAC.1